MQFLSLKSLCLTIYGTDKRLVVNAGCKAYEAILSKIIEFSIDFLLTDKDDENNAKAINASAQECYDFIKG